MDPRRGPQHRSLAGRHQPAASHRRAELRANSRLGNPLHHHRHPIPATPGRRSGRAAVLCAGINRIRSDRPLEHHARAEPFTGYLQPHRQAAFQSRQRHQQTARRSDPAAAGPARHQCSSHCNLELLLIHSAVLPHSGLRTDSPGAFSWRSPHYRTGNLRSRVVPAAPPGIHAPGSGHRFHSAPSPRYRQ